MEASSGNTGLGWDGSSTLAVEMPRSEQSTGLGTSSKLELSSADSSSFSSLYLSANLAMESVCSFMDGGDPRDVCAG